MATSGFFRGLKISSLLWSGAGRLQHTTNFGILRIFRPISDLIPTDTSKTVAAVQFEVARWRALHSGEFSRTRHYIRSSAARFRKISPTHMFSVLRKKYSHVTNRAESNGKLPRLPFPVSRATWSLRSPTSGYGHGTTSMKENRYKVTVPAHQVQSSVEQNWWPWPWTFELGFLS